jgi:D-alanyl-D-alanine dipeptidase
MTLHRSTSWVAAGVGVLALAAAAPTARAQAPARAARATDWAALRRTIERAAPADTPPPPPVAPLRAWLGLYAQGPLRVLVGESGGTLRLTSGADTAVEASRAGDTLRAPVAALAGEPLVAERGATGAIAALRVSGVRLPRVALGPESGNQLRVAPVRPIPVLRREALAAQPPEETGRDAPVDLVELTTLDRTIKLEVRYATSNNLYGTPFYSQARAFLQRPAAEAVARVHAALAPYGLGLLIHDGYRPWYVTRMFWDGATPTVRPFVADPSKGSKHNRGAAVDLALFDRATGATIPMPSTYDETTERAFPNFPGGTARERWARDLLRRFMEREGFAVYEFEWWHFDYQGWEHWPILNVPFEKLGTLAPRR